MTMPDDDKELFRSKPLVIPARVNVSELERLRNVLLRLIGELDKSIAEAERRPKTALRIYMSTLGTLAKVTDAAIGHGSKAWIRVGMKKVELSQILGKPRSTINHRLSKKEEPFDKVLSDAENQPSPAEDESEVSEPVEKVEEAPVAPMPSAAPEKSTKVGGSGQKAVALSDVAVSQGDSGSPYDRDDTDYEAL